MLAQRTVLVFLVSTVCLEARELTQLFQAPRRKCGVRVFVDCWYPVLVEQTVRVRVSEVVKWELGLLEHKFIAVKFLGDSSR